MARFKVTHSQDAACIEIQGSKSNPEPSTATIKFPGGFVEVSRHSDGSYWAHVSRQLEENEECGEVPGVIVDSRIDLTFEGAEGGRNVRDIPSADRIQKMVIRIARACV